MDYKSNSVRSTLPANKKEATLTKLKTRKYSKRRHVKLKTYTFELPVYYQISNSSTVLVDLNWYKNAHYGLVNKVKRFYHTLVSDLITKHTPRFKGKVHIKYQIYLHINNDGGNVRSVIEKFLLDSLRDNGIIPNDNIKFIISDNAEYFVDDSNPRCMVYIKEIPNKN
jgi:hypothetical protein